MTITLALNKQQFVDNLSDDLKAIFFPNDQYVKGNLALLVILLNMMIITKVGPQREEH